MMKGFIFLFPFGLLFVNGTFTCTKSDWVLDGSKCYKIIPGSPMNGQDQCSNEDPSAVLMLAPSKDVATNLVAVLLSEDKIWVGLRFRNGSEWIWDDGSTGTDIWGGEIPKVPELCISVSGNGEMFDRYCYSTHGLICQKEINGPGLCENGWTMLGTLWYKRLRQSNSGVNFRDARSICNEENAYIMMPQSQSEANNIVTSFKCGKSCWVGITDFDADHTYTWEDGTEESQSNLYFRSSEPNHRDLDNICAYIQYGLFYNGECTEKQRIVCEIDAIDSFPATPAIHISTQMEDTSAYIQTTVPSSEIKLRASTITEVSSSFILDSTHLSATPSKGSGTNEKAKYIDTTTEQKYTEQVENVTIIQRKFPVPIISACEVACITKCKSYSSQYTNGSVDASPDYLYRVDKKSLSSYQRRHYSAPDSRKSSFYIGSGGIAFLVIFGLFIIMLDVLPKT